MSIGPNRGAAPFATLSDKPLDFTVPPHAMGLHINTLVVPSFAVSYGLIRSHSYTSGGIYQTWSGIEPTTKGSRNWTVFDNWRDVHFAAGRKLVLDLSGTPDWAVSGSAVGGGANAPAYGGKSNMVPDNDQDYIDFVVAALTRSAGKVYAVNVWNEPNVPKYYNGPGATASRLATIARKVYQAVKAIDSSIIVTTPAFTSIYSGWDYPQGIGLKQFLAASDGAGGTGAQWFDVCAYHFYPNETALRPTALHRMYRGVRAVLDAAGRSDCDIWAEETGFIVPAFQDMTVQQQHDLMRCTIYTLFALGCKQVTWFGVDGSGAGSIAWGTGAARDAVAAVWNAAYDSIVGSTLTRGLVQQTRQTQLDVVLTTSRGQLRQTINGMPL